MNDDSRGKELWYFECTSEFRKSFVFKNSEIDLTPMKATWRTDDRSGVEPFVFAEEACSAEERP